VATVAFITSAEQRNLTADDRLVVSPLAERGITVVPAVWTEDVAWDDYDLVVIRSPWDWYRHGRRFEALIEDVGRRALLFNRDAQRWLDKRYLLDLARRGVRGFPTYVVQDRAGLEQALEAFESARIVLKPATAAAAHGTTRLDARDHEAARRALDAILEHDVALLQPYYETVEADGEWSLVFLGGEFSHAVKKRPVRGDFRVQEELGGTVESATAPTEVIDDAKRAVEAARQDFLYARVDGMVVPSLGGFCVTELEVVEPELFLRMDSAAPERFANAIARRLRL